jgi:hypothetical protein
MIQEQIQAQLAPVVAAATAKVAGITSRLEDVAREYTDLDRRLAEAAARAQ